LTKNKNISVNVQYAKILIEKIKKKTYK